jgi:nitric oxide reductase NorD protein
MKATDIGFDWELGVFKALRGLWRWIAPEAPPAYDAGRAALLEDHIGALRVLAQLIAGEAVRVLPARSEGGVRGRDLLLPSFVDLAPDPEANRGLYVLRVAHAAAVRRLGAPPVPALQVERWRVDLQVAGEAAEWLREDLPRFGPAWDEACALALAARPDLASLAGQAALLETARRAALNGIEIWRDDALWKRIARTHPRGPASPPVPLWGALLESTSDDRTTGRGALDGSLPDGTEIEAPAVEDLRRVMLDAERQQEKVLTHTFEKIETLDSSQGNVMKDDGGDELEEHLEALQEVDLRDLLRGGDDAHSVYRADVQADVDIPDVESIRPDERGVPYDEWDHRSRRYRKGWCTVYPTPMNAGSPSWAAEATARHRRLITRLRAQLERHRAERRFIDRQLDGEDVDIDALVDARAEVAAGRTGSGRLYIRRELRRRDFATTVLLDVSLSSDSWVANRRVLDVSREAVLVLGEVAEALGDRLQVLAFASSTRNRCRVFQVRGWGERWAVGRAKLGALEPQGYTRIGPALRHATAELCATAAERRLLLLVSDGKPSDYDRYEGRYGVSDIRMALREAERAGVTTHALAVDAVARDYLPAMLGPGGWSILPTPDHLLQALTSLYGRLTLR